MPILGINHVNLNVRDLERSRKFYELLGFEVSGHREGMLFLRVGGHHHHIGLLEVGAEAPPHSRHNVGIQHFALTVDDEAEIGRLYRALTVAGHRISATSDHRANRSFYVKDPDGILVEVTYDAPRADWADVADNPFADDRPYAIPGGKAP